MEMLRLVIMVLGVIAVCVLSKVAIAALNLHVQDPTNPDDGVSWKFPIHGMFYIIAGMVTAMAFNIQHWQIAIAAAIVLIIGATIVPGVDWSHDSKIKRTAYCFFNYAYGTIAGVILIPFLPVIPGF